MDVAGSLPRNRTPSSRGAPCSLNGKRSPRTSKFASKFTPLKRKPLDAIMDVERTKDKSLEELTSKFGVHSFGASLPQLSSLAFRFLKNSHLGSLICNVSFGYEMLTTTNMKLSQIYQKS